MNDGDYRCAREILDKWRDSERVHCERYARLFRDSAVFVALASVFMGLGAAFYRPLVVAILVMLAAFVVVNLYFWRVYRKMLGDIKKVSEVLDEVGDA